MPKKTFTPEQIVARLRQVEVVISQEKTVPLACKEAGIVDQTYYRWRKAYGGCNWSKPRSSRICRRKTRSSSAPWPRSRWKNRF
jgi:transposase-like protein